MISFMSANRARSELCPAPSAQVQLSGTFADHAVGHTVAGYSVDNMDAATVRPERASLHSLANGRGRRVRERVVSRPLHLHKPALVLLLAIALALRLWGIKQG